MPFSHLSPYLHRAESVTLEYEESPGQRADVVKTVCGMLNRRGGHVLIGVTDGGEPIGCRALEKQMQQLRGELRAIRPVRAVDPEVAEWEGGLGIVYIYVPDGSSKPYEHNGVGYYRLDAETVELSADRERDLLRGRDEGTDRWERRAARGGRDVAHRPAAREQ